MISKELALELLKTAAIAVLVNLLNHMKPDSK